MLETAGRAVMVSGASRGIGLALVETLLSKGWSVSAGVRDPASLTAKLGATDNLLVTRFDAEDRATFADWLDATLTRFGRVDGLINNAGISNTFSIEEGDETALDHLFEINVKAPLFLTRLVLPHLKASDAGRIVNISSMSGKRVRNENVAYNMSKHAIIALTHGTRRIGWDHGVRAFVVCPSFVATDLTANAKKVSREEMINADDLAELITTTMALPNNAMVAELIVNCRLEDQY
ncbi:MAG: SDR family NAD(P)-dependent oxidoreductase [Pseudomonadota bacterium]